MFITYWGLKTFDLGLKEFKELIQDGKLSLDSLCFGILPQVIPVFNKY
jgi:hypothetical protein